MKHFTLAILLLLGSRVAFAAAGDTTQQIGVDGKRIGYWIIYGRMQSDKAYAADAKVEEGNYNNGLKVGKWIHYYPTGKKQSEYTYVNNRPNGPGITYYENGNKQEEGTWVNTKWVGEYHRYYEDGTENQSFNYSQLGQRDGKQVYKNPNGTLQIEVTMKGGKEEGWKKEYDENGNLIRETFFNGGVIDPSKTKEYPHKTTSKPNTPVVDGAGSPPPPPPPPPAKWNGEGQYTLMRNGQVSQKGIFHLFKLVDGEAYFYDNNGMLLQIKKYKASKYVGDSPLPADANK